MMIEQNEKQLLWDISIQTSEDFHDITMKGEDLYDLYKLLDSNCDKNAFIGRDLNTDHVYIILLDQIKYVKARLTHKIDHEKIIGKTRTVRIVVDDE